MITTTDQYNVLNMLAEKIVSSKQFDKKYERFFDIVVQEDGKKKIVQKYSPDSTAAAVLLAMVQANEGGKDPIAFVKPDPATEKKAATGKAEDDEFTKAALADIKPGKPDPASLKAPVKIMVECGMCKVPMEKTHAKKKYCGQKCKDRAKAIAKKAEPRTPKAEEKLAP